MTGIDSRGLLGSTKTRYDLNRVYLSELNFFRILDAILELFVVSVAPVPAPWCPARTNGICDRRDLRYAPALVPLTPFYSVRFVHPQHRRAYPLSLLYEVGF